LIAVEIVGTIDPLNQTITSSLGAAHRGYEYQDLATAYFLVQLLAQQEGTVVVDKKLFEDDRFDDLTVESKSKVIRRQFKYSQLPNRRLEQADLRQDGSKIQLDALIRSHQQMRITGAGECRVCATWESPVDAELLSLLEEVPAEGSFGSFPTRCLRLRTDELWPQGGDPAWAIIKNTIGITRPDLEEFARDFLIEIDCPGSSGDFLNPGPLEALISSLLNDRIGMGRYPNQHMDARQAAELLARRAQQARSKSETLAVAQVESHLGLRKDFGRVSQQFPRDPKSFVTRDEFCQQLKLETPSYDRTLLIGAPGSGKSWTLDSLADALRGDGHAVAKHYCYLEPGDQDSAIRITTNVLWGNLIGELVDAIPELRKESVRLYSAGAEELAAILPKAVEQSPTGMVFLFVDGLDHIARVLGEIRSLASEETDIVEELAAFVLPAGVHLILGSQPGEHLVPFDLSGVHQVPVPPWTEGEIGSLVRHIGLEDRLKRNAVDCETFITAFALKSDGNPLYASYLARELLSQLDYGAAVDPTTFVESSPALEGSIAHYYQHLLGKSGDQCRLIANVLGAIDFSVQESELKQILPNIAYTIQQSLRELTPVLSTVTGQGGLRVYHESFRRYILEQLERDGHSLEEVLAPVISWLNNRGFFQDAKAFRFLLPLLRRVNAHDKVSELVQPLFVVESVAACHPHVAIVANIVVASQVAAERLDWSGMVLCAQLRAAVDTCFREMSSLAEFGETFAELFGSQQLSERLLFEGRTTYDSIDGLQLCSICDDRGDPAPWAEYLELEEEEKQLREEHESVPESAKLASIHGQIRIHGLEDMLRRVARYLKSDPRSERSFVSALLHRIRITGGVEPLRALFTDLKMPRRSRDAVAIELCRTLIEANKQPEAARIAQVSLLGCSSAWAAATFLGIGGTLSARASKRFDAGVIQIPEHVHDDEVIAEWVARVEVTAFCRPQALERERARVGERVGWFRRWLVFVIDIAQARAQIQGGDPLGSEAAANAFNGLAEDMHPFTGKPRACDLYSIWNLIHGTIRDGLSLLDSDEQWTSTLATLGRLSEETTVYLQGSQNSPLTSQAFAEILQSFLAVGAVRNRVVKELEQQAARVADSGEYYGVHAAHDLALARGLAAVGKTEEALKTWKSASRFLCGYGFHKDTMLFELVESTNSLARQSREGGIQGLVRVQPLVNAAVAHTDGKETKHLPSTWFASLIRIFPEYAAAHLRRALMSRFVLHHWVLEDAVVALVEASPRADPFIRTHLLSTRPFDKDESDLPARKEAAEEIARGDAGQGAVYFRRLLAEVEGDSPDLPRKEYELVRLAAEPLIRLNVARLEDVEPAKVDSPTSDTFGDAPMFGQAATALEVLAWLRTYVPKYAEENTSCVRFIDPFVKRLVAYRAAGRAEDSVRLLRFLARRRYASKASLMADVATELASENELQLAAIAFSLAYATSHGRSGWGVLGDNQTLPWFVQAVRYSAQDAWRTLATEVAALIAEGSVYGISQHLTEVHAECGNSSTASDTWDAAFAVLSQRFPGSEDKNQRGIFPTLTESSDSCSTLDEELASLVLTRINHPELKRKTSAIAGCGTLLRRNPDVLLMGYRELLKTATPCTSVSLLLQLLWDNEPSPYQLSAGISDLLQLYSAIDHCGIRDIACALLSRISQNPQNQSTTPNRDSQPFITRKKRQAILSLDWNHRSVNIERWVPSFRSNVVNRFETIWLAAEDVNLERSRGRHELVRRSGSTKYPQPAILGWEQEIFELAINEACSAINAPQFPSSKSHFQNDLAKGLIPNTQLAERLWFSRRERPIMPKPLEAEMLVKLPMPLADASEFHDWFRYGYFETQHYPVHRHSDPEVSTWAASGIIAGQTGPGTGLPFGIAAAEDWFAGQDELIGAKLLGPLVGLEVHQDLITVTDILLLHPRISALLGLTIGPTHLGLSLVDRNGSPAVVFRHWYGRPIWRDINSEFPRLAGCDLLARPDIHALIAKHSSGMREFRTHGDRAKIEETTSSPLSDD